MKKLTLPLIAIMCLMLVLPALATAKKPLQNHVEILYVDKDNSNTVIASAEFLPEGPGSYVLDNQSPVIIENLPQGYELLEGNHYVINVHEDGIPSPDTVKFKVQTATPETTPEPTITPAPTAEPTATPAPTAEPTATPVPTAEPTATPVPTAEPTATPAPTVEPTATPAPTAEPTATPAPTAEPTATPAPTAEPTATPAPTATPRPTAKPTASPAPGSGNVDYDTPKSGSPSVLFTAIATMAAAVLIKRR